MFRKKNSSRNRPKQSRPSETAPTFSYYASRSRQEAPSGRRLEPEAIKRLEGPPWWHHLPTFIAALAIGSSLIYSLSLSTNPKVIQPTDSSAVLLRPPDTYQQAAQTLFEDSFLDHNKITVDSGGIARQLQAQFPELANVSIALPLVGRRPLVYLQPSPPALTLATNSGLFVLDQRGRVVIVADKVNKLTDLHLPVITDQSGLGVAVGDFALTQSDVSFIQTVIGQLTAQKLSVQNIVLPPAAAELDIKLAGQPYTIKMNLQDDARQQIGAFLAAKKQLDGSGQTPSSYFDVRVNERVYYR